jgi:DhnA family fructose-bisphosphate aldolase class Ia
VKAANIQSKGTLVKHLEQLKEDALNIPVDSSWITIVRMPRRGLEDPDCILRITNTDPIDTIEMLMGVFEQVEAGNSDVPLFRGLSAAINLAIKQTLERNII